MIVIPRPCLINDERKYGTQRVKALADSRRRWTRLYSETKHTIQIGRDERPVDKGAEYTDDQVYMQ